MVSSEQDRASSPVEVAAERERQSPEQPEWDEFLEAGEEDVPTAILYVVAGLLLLSFTLFLVVGGGHSHFH